jgi:hypothetical protein
LIYHIGGVSRINPPRLALTRFKPVIRLTIHREQHW